MILEFTYFAAAALFIIGLKQMSSPALARRGILWAGVGMAVATLATLWHTGTEAGTTNLVLMLAAIAIGSAVAWWAGRIVPMTAMPQMVAVYNGMGGGSAACIAALELLGQAADPSRHGAVVLTLAVLGALIGTVAFSGSMVAFVKLQGWYDRTLRFPLQQWVNFAVFGASVAVGILLLIGPVEAPMVLLFFVLALAYGVMMALPIGGADMPVVISLFNALTGLAVGFEGFVLDNAAMIIAGTVVGAAGTLLTRLMAKAMNRSLASVLFTAFGADGDSGSAVAGSDMKETSTTDVAALMAFSREVIVIPGYGMAVAQAQHKLWEYTGLLEQRGVRVRFAIHPVAGRMPGHMNVLLAEAGVPYDKIHDLEEINSDFPNCDVALVIGANDVVNPAARSDKASPIYGMPILDADKAGNCIVIKRGRGKGFSGIENMLFYAENTRMLYGDGREAINLLVQEVKNLDQ